MCVCVYKRERSRESKRDPSREIKTHTHTHTHTHIQTEGAVERKGEGEPMSPYFRLGAQYRTFAFRSMTIDCLLLYPLHFSS